MEVIQQEKADGVMSKFDGPGTHAFDFDTGAGSIGSVDTEYRSGSGSGENRRSTSLVDPLKWHRASSCHIASGTAHNHAARWFRACTRRQFDFRSCVSGDGRWRRHPRHPLGRASMAQRNSVARWNDAHRGRHRRKRRDSRQKSLIQRLKRSPALDHQFHPAPRDRPPSEQRPDAAVE